MPARPVLTALAATGSAALVVGLLATPAEAAPTTIRIVTIDDYHGRLEADDRAGIPGAAVLAGAVTALSAGQPSAFVAAGDSIGATPFVSAVQEDAPTIDALNLMGLQTSAVGNHEFDRGYSWLVDPANHGIDGAGRAGWDTLGANVDGENPQLAPSRIIVVGGVSVGLVGVVTQQTSSLVSPDGIAGITFSNPVAPSNAAADALRDGDPANGEADVVILLAHEGAPSRATDAAACESLRTGGSGFGGLISGANANIDAIVGGHTDSLVECSFPKPGVGLPRPVIQGNSYGASLGQIDLTVDPTTSIVSAVSATVVDVVAGGYTPDPDVEALVADAVAQAEIVGSVPVGEITADITRAVTAAGEDDRGSESALGNFIADVQLAATKEARLGGAQLAFMNPGGIRADFLVAPSGAEAAGVVTYAEAATVQPFANGVVTISLTGAQVKSVLEEQWQPDGSSRPFLALGLSKGLFYTFDASAARGDRIKTITLNGTAIDPAATYRVTVNSFLAAGGDNFATLAAGTARQDNGFNDLNVLVDYFEANSPVTADTAPRRAVFVAAASPASATPTASPTPSTRPTAVAAGQNRGLSVDTGRTGGSESGTLVLGLALALLLLGGGAVAVVRPVLRRRH